MADMGPRGGKNAGGAGLSSRTRHWDEGGPSDFAGRIHPFPGEAAQIKDGASVKQPSGKEMPGGSKNAGPKNFPPPQNVQSAKAPRHSMPEAVGRLANVKCSDKAIQMGRTGGMDKGPKGSGKRGGAGVTAGRGR